MFNVIPQTTTKNIMQKRIVEHELNGTVKMYPHITPEMSQGRNRGTIEQRG